MAHTKSSIKDLKRIRKRTTRNRTLKSKMRTFVKKAHSSIESGSDDSGDKLKTAIRVLDKMVSKGIVHPNNAARKKSRMVEQRTKVLKGIPIHQPSTKKVTEEKPAVDTVSETATEKPE